MKQIIIFLTLAIFSLPVNAAGDIADSPWPMFQHDMFHTGYSTFYGPDMEREDENNVKFKKNVAAGISSPVIDIDGTVYIGSTDGWVYKVSPDGEESDRIFETGGPIESTPVITDDGTIYVGSNDGSLYAITTRGGKKWSLKLGDKLMSSPAVGPNGRIFIGSSKGSDNESSDNESSVSGFLYSITSEGKEVWKYPTGEISHSSPAIDQFGNVHIGSTDGILYAVGSDGTLLWSYEADDDISTSPVISSDGTIYFTTASSLTALDSKGNEKWAYTPKGTIFGMEEESGLASSPAVREGTEGRDTMIYVGGLLGDLHCINDAGEKQWTIMIKSMAAFDFIIDPERKPAPVLSAPTLDMGGDIYVRSGNSLYIHGPDGQALISDLTVNDVEVEMEANIEASIALGADRTLYVASGDGYLYAFGPVGPSISGTIAGDEKEGVTVFLKGAEDERSTVTGDNGEYIFRSLYRGKYLLTPDKNGFKFSPPSRDLTLRSSDIEGINFTSEPEGPAVISAQADPSRVLNDSTTAALLTAEVFHPLGPVDIESVKIDLSGIGGSSEQEMYDDGTQGDEKAGDGIYSYSAVVIFDTSLGPKAIKVIATDTMGVSDQKILTLEVASEIISSVTTCDPANPEHTILIDAEGQNLILTYRLLAGDVPLILKIFNPSNSTDQPDHTVTVTSDESTLEIENVREGTWRLIVCVESSSARVKEVSQRSSSSRYSISSATSGTGVVYGKVTDAQTGEDVGNVRIMTSTGGSSITEAGYYLLLNPAGVLIITASDSDHASVSRSATLISGSSVEINILLGPKIENRSECPAASAFGSSKEILGLLRKLRDTVLDKTTFGRSYINTYYRFAPEVTDIISSDPALRQEVKTAVTELLPVIEKVLGNKPVTLDDSQTAGIKKCLVKLKAKGSISLKKELDAFIKKLDQGRLPQDLNLF